MTLDLTQVKIYLRPGPTDLRKAGNGLAILVEQGLELNPFGASLFLFCNAKRTLLKALYWERNGFCLWQKRLERDRFPWPKDHRKAQEINHEELLLLLAGIDFWKAHKEIFLQRVS
jgi:transposase